ncbi:MAG: Hsp20/alpha crystallin family protein [Lachnospiraceae bacterium]|nr:Hsp20/alpha crystallin family protein [Lachnospiraceae bacterium]
MLTPSIFGESLFDDWMDDFPFGKDFEKEFEKSMFPAKNPLYGKHAKNLMKTDVRETDDAYEVDIDLPGFKKDEVTAELKDGYITISASKGLDKDEKDKKTGKYIRKERYAGSMSRSFYVGEDVTQDEISAKFENGILQLKVPKKANKAVEGKNYIAIEG